MLPKHLLLQLKHDVVVEPEASEHCWLHLRGACNPSQALIPCAALTPEGLDHGPFRAWVEEGQDVSRGQRAVVGHTDFHLAHVEDEGRVTGVVAVDEVGVELDAGVHAVADGGVGILGCFGCCCDFGKQCAGGESDVGVGGGRVGSVALLDLEPLSVAGLFPSRSEFRHDEGGICDLLVLIDGS